MTNIPEFFFSKPNSFIFLSDAEIREIHDSEVDTSKITDEIIENKMKKELNNVKNLINMKNKYDNLVNEKKNINLKKLKNLYMEYVNKIYDENIYIEMEIRKQYIKDDASIYILKELTRDFLINTKINKNFEFKTEWKAFSDEKYCKKISNYLNEQINLNKEKYKILDIVPNFSCNGKGHGVNLEMKFKN